MAKDKRKARRKPLHYAAQIGENDQLLQGCFVHDISESGARLDVGDPTRVPDVFTLILSERGSGARRTCRVVWRTAGQIGVEFEMRHAADGQSRQFKTAMDAAHHVTLVPQNAEPPAHAPATISKESEPT
ncbi:MAG TPA: PilZ domain-containing protein [Pseudolabrys sp.]|nr:PilZ domain-containing protein [Pseudolabrys sp.]